MSGPAYVCAIIHYARRRYLFERRPAGDGAAGGRLTCFGGGRRAGEHPERALLRELREELAWTPKRWRPAVDLYVGGAWIARFYDVPTRELPRVPTPGLGDLIRRLDATQLDHPLVSRWHRHVLRAWHRGRRRVDLPA